MRASYRAQLEILPSYVIHGEALHHLVNVIRITVGEELLLLDGKGLKVQTEVESISKKEIRLRYRSHQTELPTYSYDLILGMPKKEALELSLREAVETGFRNIFLVRSDYSQMRFLEEERVQKLLVSSLEQSNAPYLPNVLQSSWEEIPWETFDQVLMLDSQALEPSEAIIGGQRIALIVGPEGGFSPTELAFLRGKKNLRAVRLPTPILRTPTAVAVGAGLLLAKIAGSNKL